MNVTMKKGRSMRFYMSFAAVLFLGLGMAGCGTKDDKKSNEVVDKKDLTEDGNSEDSSIDPNTGKPIPKGDGYSGMSRNGSLTDIVGTFEQVENRETKLRIDSAYLVITNIELPIPTGNGPVRLTPRFPHHLSKKGSNEYFNTIGYYNDGNQLWDNVELRIVPHQGNRLLDVTFVLPKSAASTPTSGSQDQYTGSANETSGQPVYNQPAWPPYNPCDPFPWDPCNPCPPQYWDPCDPYFPQPCPDPCPPVNPCPPATPCPDDDDDTGRVLLYRFELVAPEDPEQGQE